MAKPPESPRGRAAATNPANRFERIEVESEEPAPQKVETLYLRDTSRTVLATNESPDVPFDVSLNPYRGCEHGCIYCLDGETQILTGDGSTRTLADLCPGDEIYGTIRKGHYRRYVRTRVRAHWRTRQPAYRIELADGTELTAGSNHRFLTERGWKYVVGTEQGRERRPHLTTNNKLMGTGAFGAGPNEDDLEYQRGYLCGMIRGDGHLASYSYQREGRNHADQHQFRLALADHEGLDRASHYLRGAGVDVRFFEFQSETSTSRPIYSIRTHARRSVERVRRIVEWPVTPTASWRLGFLGGIFDAEGSYSCGVLRIPNTDAAIIRWILDSMRSFGFRSTRERPVREHGKPIQVVRLLGGLKECLRFLHRTGAAIVRKRDIEGQALKSAADLQVVTIEPLEGKRDLFDIETGTGDFIANGVVSHNCYARPTHEYLGFSAGLDFESRILVKPDAPELLARELDQPGWKPQFIGLSGVTDPYQPVERKLELTRRCLEVLAAYRNPVGIVTKNRLVERDADLLVELAEVDAAAVYLSVTTLRPEITRVMEPRTSRPPDRLTAIRNLTAAGIPCGVLVAPVVPGLTDHEIPQILAAAADAGARFASFIPLRLPGAVAPLFESWLEEHFPDRKKRVLNRVRDMRGGRLNDARFGARMRGEGVYAEQVEALFETTRRRLGLEHPGPRLSTDSFRRPSGHQLDLFTTGEPSTAD